jgi:hypothetical protein
VVCGLWFVVCGLWFVVCGLWFVVRGLWFVVCGLWFVVHNFSFPTARKVAKNHGPLFFHPAILIPDIQETAADTHLKPAVYIVFNRFSLLVPGYFFGN